MKRRDFIGRVALGSGTVVSTSLLGMPSATRENQKKVEIHESGKKFQADLIIAGAGLGGCAAAFAAMRNGLTVVLTEETDWLGGQLSQQGVPPDEHQWIETHGAPELYRKFRDNVRAYYRRHYPLTAEAAANERLNPGNGSVSRLCHEPKVAHRVLEEMFAPYESARKILILKDHKVRSAAVNSNRVSELNGKGFKIREGLCINRQLFCGCYRTGGIASFNGY